MSEFRGGHLPASHEVWTATVGSDGICEEIDVMVPRNSSEDEIRVAVQVVLDADYMPGLRILDVSPFLGITVWR